MKDWLQNIIENYTIIWIVIIWIAFGIAALIVNLIINRLLYQLSEKRRIQYIFSKSLFLGIAIPIVAMWLWFNSKGNPFNEYRLITNPTTAIGFINKVELESDVVDYNDSRSAAEVYFYLYEFTFKLPNGSIIHGGGTLNGDIPENLADVENKPYQVIVEYLSNNPNVNRVKGFSNAKTNVYEWLRYTFFGGIIVLMLSSYCSFIIIKSGLKEYRAGLQILKKY